MHHMRLCVQDRGFHRKKCLMVTSGSPLPCHVIPNFPPLCSSLCCWCVLWKMPESVEQMPLFFLDHGAWGFWAGRPVSYVEATVDLVLMDQRLHCLVFWNLLTTVWSSVSDLYKGWIRAVLHIRNVLFVWDQQSYAAVELTWGRRAEVIDWQGKKIKVMTCDCHGNFWPSSLCASVHWQRKKQRNDCIFSLIAQSGFSNVLLWNRNIEGIDQLSCSPCLWDIAAVLCNKGRKWKQTKKKSHPRSEKQFSCD